MSELNVLFFAILLKGIATCMAIAGAVFIMSEGRDGWGWLIFLAVVLGSTSYRYTPDNVEPVKVEQQRKENT